MKASELLRNAAALPSTKYAFARDSVGASVSLNRRDAVCFCPVGALQRLESDSQKYAVAYTLIQGAAARLGIAQMGVMSINDHTNLMPDVWSEAIEAAEALGL